MERIEENKDEEYEEYRITRKNILFIGNSGFGKSSTINFLLQEEKCQVSQNNQAATQEPQFCNAVLN